MSVETNINFITDLNDSFPRRNDLIKEGDDHIRLIKRVIKNTIPGFNKVVSITADKLNLIDSALTLDAQSVTTNTAFKIGVNKGFNANGNRLTNLGTPVDDLDAVTLKYLTNIVNNITWPVGSLYFSEDGTNPATKFGFGNWIPWGSGRVIVASGTSTDPTGESRNFLSGGTGGTFRRTLGIEHMPNHNHNAGSLSTTSNGSHIHKFSQLQIASPSPDTKHGSPIAQYGMTSYDTEPAGDHTHSIIGSTESVGGGSPFEISQPFIVCNVWKRVS